MIKYLYLLVGLSNLFIVMRLIMNDTVPRHSTIIIWGVYVTFSMFLAYYTKKTIESLTKSLKGKMNTTILPILNDSNLTKEEKEVKIQNELNNIHKED